MHPYISGCTQELVVGRWGSLWISGLWVYSLQASIAKLASTAATDVGMHGLLAIVNRVAILCYPLVCVHCGPVEDFFITKQTSLHPFDFVRNLFHLLYNYSQSQVTIGGWYKWWYLWYSWTTSCTVSYYSLRPHQLYTDVLDIGVSSWRWRWQNVLLIVHKLGGTTAWQHCTDCGANRPCINKTVN